MDLDESESSLPNDQERERRFFGFGFSSLSFSDSEAPPAAPGPSKRDNTSDDSMSSRVVRYDSYNATTGHQSKSESIQEENDRNRAENISHPFLRKFLLRSPMPDHRKRSPRRTIEYPPPRVAFDPISERDENSPLLNSSTTTTAVEDPFLAKIGGRETSEKEKQAKRCQMASIFLTDYERARPPTLPSKLDSISDTTLRIHKLRYSFLWRSLTNLAVIALFIACCFEGDESVLLPFSFKIFAISVLSSDIAMQRKLNLPDSGLAAPMLTLMACMLIEMLVIVTWSIPGRFLFSSIPTPLALFYWSEKARNAFEALRRIAPIVGRVLALELLLILSFAAVACRLYSRFESFATLSTAWLSLFQLSTTVVNPAMWMPMYNESRRAALFFVTFVTTATLYLHSLVLSVVFQTYVQASTEIHERFITDREDAIRLAFLSLQDSRDQEGAVRSVRTSRLRQTLEIVRPHYNGMKINALLDMLAPSQEESIDYLLFRTKIRQALNASIRSTPSRNLLAYIVEFSAAVVAISNFVYVILLTSSFQADWFDVITLPVGFAITVLGLFELVARADPFGLFHFTPTTRLNGTFDGLAALAAAVSCWALLHYDYQLELLLTGRAIDMIRIMRFQKIFRDVVRRSGEVIPALAGPLALVVATNHLFVYLGMAIWGGAIEVGTYPDITPLYDLNNFNSYLEGLVTMFQVLIVNDWHAISEVYLYASWNASPFVVYPFFIGGNLVSVSIMLNCLIAFFVGAFVTKLDEVDLEEESELLMVHQQKPKEFKIDTSRRSVRKIASAKDLSGVGGDKEDSDRSQVVEFEVFERETFDKIMQTVAGGTDDSDTYAKQVCDMLELYERLSPTRSKLGYLVCCQQTMNRFGNRRFQVLAEDFMEVNLLHSVVSNMHGELLTIANKDGAVERTFAKNGLELRLTASLLRPQPAVSLFVTSVVGNAEAHTG